MNVTLMAAELQGGCSGLLVEVGLGTAACSELELCAGGPAQVRTGSEE